MNKKGLAIIYDPHNLYQFIWYYCNNDNSKKRWDALCLPNGYKGEYMHTFCEKTNIFDKIYRSELDYTKITMKNKLLMFLKMVLFFFMGKRRVFCKKLLNKFVNEADYDEIVIIAVVGLISGICAALGKEKKVVILEDGYGDYSSRPKYIDFSKVFSFYNWQGYLISLMGYSSPGWFWLSTDKNCIKYCSQPEKMLYHNYREICLLYQQEGTDELLFQKILSDTYPEIKKIDFDKADSIVFTRPLNDFVKNPKSFIDRFQKYIMNNCHSIILKKHPRESNTYCFGEAISVQNVDNSVPAEVLLPFIKNKKIIVLTTSSIIWHMKGNNLQCQVLLYDDLYNISVKENTMFTPMTIKETKQFCEKFAEGHFIIHMI